MLATPAGVGEVSPVAAAATVGASWLPDIAKAAADVEGAADDDTSGAMGDEINDDGSVASVLNALLLGAIGSLAPPAPIFGFELETPCSVRVVSAAARASMASLGSCGFDPD
jgi:hypothetical protein